MNLVECYIEKVISVKPCEKFPEYIEATYIYNCHGSFREVTRLYEPGQWEEILERGYFMG